MHAWPLNYAELRIEDLRSPDELSEIVYDAGVQLGRGHPKRWSESEAEVELAAETVRAWERFRDVPSP